MGTDQGSSAFSPVIRNTSWSFPWIDGLIPHGSHDSRKARLISKPGPSMHGCNAWRNRCVKVSAVVGFETSLWSPGLLAVDFEPYCFKTHVVIQCLVSKIKQLIHVQMLVIGDPRRENVRLWQRTSTWSDTINRVEVVGDVFDYFTVISSDGGRTSTDANIR